MHQRGFESKLLDRWEARFVSELTLFRSKEDEGFTVENVIALPIRDRDENLLSWVYRATDESPKWMPRYIYSPGFDASLCWFGLNQVGKEKKIHVAEGPLDAMWLDQHGYSAIAAMGATHKNPRKFKMLADFRKIVVWPDYDDAGFLLADEVGSSLRGKVPVFVCRWPSSVAKRTGKVNPDPQDVKLARDLRLMADRAIPFQLWKVQTGQ